MSSDELVFDSWTPLSFKRVLGGRTATTAGLGWVAPSWTGSEARRLLAYTILRSYADNSAREFMQSNVRDDIDERREYGDAALLVNAVMGALLGDSQTVQVDGADDDDTEAQLLQDWYQTWADKERLPLKLIETERKAVGLGDGVYSLGWNGDKGRPRLRVWDPGFYFPVLDDGNEDDYPRKVHLAWEVTDPDSTLKGKILVRRITWELGPIMPANLEALMNGASDVEVFDGDTFDEVGGITRQYAWNDEPSDETCYLTDATWVLDKGKQTITDLTEGEASYAHDDDGPINRRDLAIDFVPVIHVPNTVSLLEHYGRSSISTVLQILDDLSAADTDLSKAAATTGSPPIALERATMGGASLTYKPGEILETGEGKLTVLDTSKSLDALIGYISFLLKRLSVNARVPEAVLGRVSPSEVPSGIALALSFGPLEQMVKEMRLVRAEKYPLLLKFAHRLAIAGGDTNAPPVFDKQADLVMGSYLPQDQAEAVALVTRLLAAKPRPVISLETGIGMLIDAGFPIRDAAKEVEAILHRDFEGAGLMLEALGEESLVFEYLGQKMPANPTPKPSVQQLPLGTKLGPDGQPL